MSTTIIIHIDIIFIESLVDSFSLFSVFVKHKPAIPGILYRIKHHARYRHESETTKVCQTAFSFVFLLLGCPFSPSHIGGCCHFLVTSVPEPLSFTSPLGCLSDARPGLSDPGRVEGSICI
ncbi:hypothetical protein QVD17_31271 [Tagetes erecta]|uniref:Uncharacterized protein n=1 Tax=Tagetes erecta TaxID=13708 RepID=A0AAD8NND4_TARER|nr:hypothetical protein QVD17_31271 [Tagetes erecta]